jgi:hypothetical protein
MLWRGIRAVGHWAGRAVAAGGMEVVERFDGGSRPGLFPPAALATFKLERSCPFRGEHPVSGEHSDGGEHP